MRFSLHHIRFIYEERGAGGGVIPSLLATNLLLLFLEFHVPFHYKWFNYGKRRRWGIKVTEWRVDGRSILGHFFRKQRHCTRLGSLPFALFASLVTSD